MNKLWKVIKPYIPAIGMALFTLVSEIAAVKADEEQEQLKERIAYLEAAHGIEVTPDEN